MFCLYSLSLYKGERERECVCVCVCVCVCLSVCACFHAVAPILANFFMMVEDLPGEVLNTWKHVFGRGRLQAKLLPHYYLCEKDIGMMTTLESLLGSLWYLSKCQVLGLTVSVLCCITDYFVQYL
jgi:hypothetical protein